MIAIAVCSTLQIILLTKRVCSFLSLSATKKSSKRIQPLRVFFAQPPLLLLRQLRVILLRRSSVLPVVPLPHRTRDETEGQPHENFLIHVHALRCERCKTDQSVNNSFIGFPRLSVPRFLSSRGHGTKRNTRLIVSTRFARPMDVKRALPRRRFHFFFRSFFRFGWVPPSRILPVPLRARTSANHEYARIVASRTYRFRDTPCAPSSFVVNQLCSFVERVRLKLKPSKIGFSEFCL
jgi:hypothetical protein